MLVSFIVYMLPLHTPPDGLFPQIYASCIAGIRLRKERGWDRLKRGDRIACVFVTEIVTFCPPLVCSVTPPPYPEKAAPMQLTYTGTVIFAFC